MTPRPLPSGPTDAGLTARVLSSEWQTIETLPPFPMTVIFYSANTIWHDMHGRSWGENGEVMFDREPYRDERVSAGYWNGNEWCWLGTGHEVWEFEYDEFDIGKSTHWMPLPTPPTNPKGAA